MTKKKDYSGFYILLFIAIFAISATREYVSHNLNMIIQVSCTIAFVVIFVLIMRVFSKRRAHKKWVAYLKDKYRDHEVVHLILEGRFWKGQTAEQLIDSIGKPAAIDEQILKTKRKEIWKYGHKHSDKYSLRITLENNCVVGWDQKS